MRWMGFLFSTAILLVAAAGARNEPAPAPATQPTAPSPPASQPAASESQDDSEVLAVLHERLPMRHERLMELKETAPHAYARHLRRMKRWYADWRQMPPAVQEADILQQQMNVRIWRLVGRLRMTTSQEAKARLQQELADAVARQIDAENRLNEYRLEMLEKKLARLRQHLEEHHQQRQAVIQDRIGRLLRAATRPADDADTPNAPDRPGRPRPTDRRRDD